MNISSGDNVLQTNQIPMLDKLNFLLLPGLGVKRTGFRIPGLDQKLVVLILVSVASDLKKGLPFCRSNLG